MKRMLMKLCDVYEEYCQMKFDLPLAKEGIVTDNSEVKDYVKKLVDEGLKEVTPKEGSLSKLLNGVKEPQQQEGKQTRAHERQYEVYTLGGT